MLKAKSNILKAKHHALCTILCALFFCLQFVAAQNLPALKNKAEAVQDYVGLLSQSDRAALNEKLRSYADSTSTGIVIAIVSTVDDDINYEAVQLLTKWGVGQKGKDNGVLILMAAESRKVAISTGYGVESYLTDALSRQIIEQDMIPAFKRGDYYAGFDAATTSIMQVLQGTYKADKRTAVNDAKDIFAAIFVFVIIVLLFILAIKRGNKGGGNGNNSRGLDLFDIIMLSSLGRSSGGGFSSGGFGGFGGGSSGGFGGFGGGMGGGGGASGSW